MLRQRIWVLGCSIVVLGSVFAVPAAVAATKPMASFAAAKFTFEQDQRINSLTLQSGTNAFAPHNAIGQALTSTALGQLQPSLTASVKDGATSVLFEMPGLTDLTGTNAPSLTVGALDGAPIEPAGNPATYNGSSDLDWWYAPTVSEINATGTAKRQLIGSIVGHALTASTSEATLNLGGGLGRQSLSSVRLAATTGASSAPLESTNNYPPGHLPIEKVPTTLQSFATMTAGQFSANASAASLAATPLPPTIATDCTGYTSGNSLLDLFVSGCTFDNVITLVRPTQPDQVDPNVPAAGAGGPYRLTVNGSKVVTGCVDKSAASVPLAGCLTAAAYSAYFTFTTDRVIVRNPSVYVSPSRGAPVTSVTISGSGFQPGETVKVTYKTGLTSPNPVSVTLCTTPATAAGAISCAAKIPNATKAGAAGSHKITAKGVTSHLDATTKFALT